MLHYTYNATGQKISQQLEDDGRMSTRREYAGPFVYVNHELGWVNTPHGRIYNLDLGNQGSQKEYILEFHLRDHLGNTRLVLEKHQDEYIPTQQAFYYPFGMAIAGLSQQLPENGRLFENRYLYNGKEYQDDFGLNWYDYGARFYDPQIARWHVIDPHAENYLPVSPYAYVANNPIIFIDPDGRDLWHINEKGEIVHHDPDFKDADMFVSVSYDNEGNVVEGQSITFEYGTVKSHEEKNIRVEGMGTQKITLFFVKGDESGTELFEFFDKTTTKEWHHGMTGKEGSGENIVGTMHHKSKSAVGHYISQNQVEGNLRELNHNHPQGTYPSATDIDNAAVYQDRHPNIRLSVFASGPNRYIPYNKDSNRNFSGYPVARPMPLIGPPILIP